MENKNVKAIDKIISELSHRDYVAAHERFFKHRKKVDKKGNPVQFPGYSLAQDTMEAIETKHDYINGKITEEEYKSYCLKYNLTTN